MTDFHNNSDEERREKLDMVQNKVSEKLGNIWWAFMIRGCLAGLLGLIALFMPSGSIAMLLRIAGLFLIIDGVTVLLSFRNAGERQAGTAQGVFTGLAGLLLLVMPSASVRMVIILLGLWALVTGAGHLWTARKMDRQDTERGTVMSVGVFASLAGLVLILWPGIAVIAIGWIIAILSFLISALLILVALRLKRVQQRVGQTGFHD